MKKTLIITTINPKTEAVDAFANLLEDWEIILVGDKKSQSIEDEGNITFLSVEKQKEIEFETADVTPYNHYARKNIGYLYAIKSGAEVIYDTDDDNIPYQNWVFPKFKQSELVTTESRYWNVYKHFTEEKVWPRGYPLDEINSKISYSEKKKEVDIGVWQGLADKEPDVDAIHRLTIGKQIIFNTHPPITLDKHVYCPFNSQNTLWRKNSFPLLYLPSTVSFRFTDILRGYITQRLLWKNDHHLGFTQSTVYQDRNEHDLMADFKSEIDCYLQSKSVVNILESINLDEDYLESLKKVYTALSKEGIVSDLELNRLEAWSNDIKILI